MLTRETGQYHRIQHSEYAKIVGGTGAAACGNVIDNVAGLTTTSNLTDGQAIKLQGYYTKGDGGGQELIYRATGRSGITIDGGFYFTGYAADDYFEARDKTIAVLQRFGVQTLADPTATTTAINNAANAARAEDISLVDIANQEARYDVNGQLDLRDLNVDIGGRIYVASSFGGTAVRCGGNTVEFEGFEVRLKVRRSTTATWGDGSVGIRVDRGRNSSFKFECRGFDTGVQLRPTVTTYLIAFCKFEHEILHCRICLHIWTENDSYVNSNQWHGGSITVKTEASGDFQGQQVAVQIDRDGTSDITENVFYGLNVEADAAELNAGARLFLLKGTYAATATKLIFHAARIEVGPTAQLVLFDLRGYTEVDFNYTIIDADNWCVRESGSNNYIAISETKFPVQVFEVDKQWYLDASSNAYFPLARVYDISTGGEITSFNHTNTVDSYGELQWSNGNRGPGQRFKKKWTDIPAVLHTNAGQMIVLAWDSGGTLISPIADTATSMDFAANTAPTADTITRSSGSWITDGFAVDMEIEVRNATVSANNGVYRIAALTATVLTVEKGDMLTASTADTAATVHRYGVVVGRDVIGSGLGWRLKGNWVYIGPGVDRFFIGFAPWNSAETYRQIILHSKTENELEMETKETHSIAKAKTPATAAATGTAGEIAWDASYIYVCTAANTWKRVAIATW